jgi:hypothetical protein
LQVIAEQLRDGGTLTEFRQGRLVISARGMEACERIERSRQLSPLTLLSQGTNTESQRLFRPDVISALEKIERLPYGC